MYKAYKQGKADAFDEIIDSLLLRLKWGNEFYALAIKHSIEVASLFKEQNK